MTARTAILGLFALLITAICRADVTNNFVQTSDLRSAYLQRAGVVEYDESNASPAGLRDQLQRHFDVVLKVLEVSTPHSIETAIARMEAAGNYSWTSDERIAHRRALMAARREQLQRISAYRDRAIFPLNEGHLQNQHRFLWIATGPIARWGISCAAPVGRTKSMRLRGRTISFTCRMRRRARSPCGC